MHRTRWLKAFVSVFTVLALASPTARAATIDVTSFGATGDGIADDSPAIAKALEAAVQAGPGATLVFPKRVYRMDAVKRGGGYYFDLKKLERLTVEGNGSTLRLHPHAGILFVQECRHVAFRGFIIEHDPLPFTQGTIREVDTEHGEFTLAIDDGYGVPPARVLGAAYRVGTSHQQSGFHGLRYWGVVMDPVEPHRRWGVNDFLHVDALMAVDNQPRMRRIKLTEAHVKLLTPVRPGDRFFLPLLATEDGRPIAQANVRIVRSSDCSVEDVTMYSGCNGMDFGIGRNEGLITLRGVKIMLKPGSRNQTTTWRDGMHFKDNRIGPVIEDCYFEGLQDDSINISASTAMAAQQVSPTEFLLVGVQFDPGDRVLVCHPTSGRRTETVVQSSERRPGALLRVVLKDPVGDVVPGRKQETDVLSTHFYNMTYANDGFVVRNCTFKPQRIRAILVRGCHGLVEGNTIEGVGGHGIAMLNEIGYFYEGPFPRDCVIRNNTIRNTQGYPILIGTSLSSRAPKVAQTGNIRVENNTIQTRPQQSAIVVNVAENVAITGNRILDPDGKEIGRKGIRVANSTNVSVSDSATPNQTQ